MVSAQVDSMQVSDTATCVSPESTPTEFKVLDLIRFRGTSYTQLPFRERCLWLEKFLRDQIEEVTDDDPVCECSVVLRFVRPYLSIHFTDIGMGDSELDRLSTQLEVDAAVGDTFLHAVVDEKVEHPRVSLYKNRGRAIDQERRWRRELEAIRRKTKRRGTFDLNRNLHLLEVDRPISEVEAVANSHPWVSKPSNYRGASWRSYSKRLMLAEWLLFMPETFATDYRMKLCPKGRHVLVFAAKGITRVLSRTGGLIMKTVSRLPG
ncbi:hypothetical protein AHF37_10499, partial [Paragonimus kellicotti]